MSRGVAGRQATGPSLPDWLSEAADVGSKAFLLAVALVTVAFLTDPTPTQDLPGVGLPVTLPVSQPHLGHSVATYLAGMWLWEFSFPLALLAAYERWGRARYWGRHLLLGLPAVYVVALYLYCALVYVPAVTPTPLGPAATAVCWAFCATGDPVWSAATAGVAALGLLSWRAVARGTTHAGWLAALFGVLALPLGVPALYWGCQLESGD